MYGVFRAADLDTFRAAVELPPAFRSVALTPGRAVSTGLSRRRRAGCLGRLGPFRSCRYRKPSALVAMFPGPHLESWGRGIAGQRQPRRCRACGVSFLVRVSVSASPGRRVSKKTENAKEIADCRRCADRLRLGCRRRRAQQDQRPRDHQWRRLLLRGSRPGRAAAHASRRPRQHRHVRADPAGLRRAPGDRRRPAGPRPLVAGQPADPLRCDRRRRRRAAQAARSGQGRRARLFVRRLRRSAAGDPAPRRGSPARARVRALRERRVVRRDARAAGAGVGGAWRR